MISEEEEKKTQTNLWRCSNCHFDNFHLLPACEICQAPKPHTSAAPKQMDPFIKCLRKDCLAQNPLDADYCMQCANSLFGQEEKPRFSGSGKARIDKQLVKCPHCSLQNHVSNKYCLNCNKLLIKPVTMPAKMYISGPGVCPKCHQPLKNFHGLFGGVGIGHPPQPCDCEVKDKTSTTICSFCDQKVAREERDMHAEVCKKRQQFFDKAKNTTFQRCSHLQIETVCYMHLKYEPIHYKYHHSLLTRVRKLGFTEADLENLHHYITHYAPIIVHMRVTNFQYFAKDTHYRNMFQVQKMPMGGGGGRVQWQDRMFDHMHHDASNFQRVKYGTMNFTNDPKGVAVAAGYGMSYFLLKPHVRGRCTITDMDSASATATIGTFRFVNQVLVKLSDAELQAAFQGSKGKEMLSHVIGAYKQIQIHGPIEFAYDIQRVYICKAQLAQSPESRQLVKEFCLKNKLEYEEFEARKNNTVIHYGIGHNQVKSAPQRFIKQDAHQSQQKEPQFQAKNKRRGRKR